MSNETENRCTYTIKQDKQGIGMVQIADDVVAAIAGIAALEIEGVNSLSGNFPNEIADRIKGKNASNTKGVSVEVLDSNVSISLSLVLDYGYSIPEVTSLVQDRVRASVENMTGLSIIDVNIKITGVNIDKSK